MWVNLLRIRPESHFDSLCLKRFFNISFVKSKNKYGYCQGCILKACKVTRETLWATQNNKIKFWSFENVYCALYSDLNTYLFCVTQIQYILI